MKLDVTEVLKNLNGDDLIEPDVKGEAKPVTLRTIFLNALMIPVEGDNGVKKVEKYVLAMDIQKNDEVDVTPEQIVLLKGVIEKPYGPVVVGPVFAILNSVE